MLELGFAEETLSRRPLPSGLTGCPHFLPSSPASGSYQQCVWFGDSQPSSLTQGPLTVPLSLVHTKAHYAACHKHSTGCGSLRKARPLAWMARGARRGCSTPSKACLGCCACQWLACRCPFVLPGRGIPFGAAEVAFRHLSPHKAPVGFPRDSETHGEGSQESLGTAPAGPSLPPPRLQVGAAGAT